MPDIVDTQLLAQWQKLGCELGQTTPAWQREGARLLRHWKRWPRAYHTTAHLNACLGHAQALARHQPEALVNPTAVELALWFHDAVYWPWSRCNEERSAEWAVRFLRSCDVDDQLVEQVQRHIMATKKHDAHASADTALVLDIDLAILGSAPPTYYAFECNVQREYAFVPAKRYKAGRLAVLQSFAQRPTIYLTPYFAQHYEKNARTNINHAIACLQAGQFVTPQTHEQ